MFLTFVDVYLLWTTGRALSRGGYSLLLVTGQLEERHPNSVSMFIQ